MAYSFLGPKSQPQFSDLDAPDLSVDSNLVANYAAKFGNYASGTNAERLAFTSYPAWEGLEWWAYDIGVKFRFNNGAWKELGPKVLAATGKSGVKPESALTIIQTGRFAAVTDGDGTLPLCNFDFPFPGGVSSVQLTTASGAGAAAVLNNDALTVGSFGAIITSAPNTAVVIYWTAIGW